MKAIRELSLTFDDAPRKAGMLMSDKKRTQRIIDTLANHGVEEAMFFCNTVNINPNNMDNLLAYARAGHCLANHTHRHLYFNTLERNEMMEEIDLAHKILAELPGFAPWFRFPYSIEGKTVEDRHFVCAELAKRGYRIGYYTIDIIDWCMWKILKEELHQNKALSVQEFSKACILIILGHIEFCDHIARMLLKRSPQHVLLLHECDLTALLLDDMLSALKRRGWQIISATQAFNDPISHQIPQGFMTQSRLHGLVAESQYAGTWTPLLQFEEDLRNYFIRLGICAGDNR